MQYQRISMFQFYYVFMETIMFQAVVANKPWLKVSSVCTAGDNIMLKLTLDNIFQLEHIQALARCIDIAFL